MPDDVAAPAKQDQPTESYYRELLAARGMPVFSGGAPDDGEEVDGKAPDANDGPPGDQPADGAEGSFTESYDPNSVPEEVRPQLEAAYKQLQSDYSRKRGEESATVQEAQELRQFVEAMQDPATRDAILEREFGYQFEDEGGDQQEYLDPEDEIRARLEQVEGSLTQQQEQQMLAQQTAEETENVAEGIEALEKTWGEDFEFSPKALKVISTYAQNHGPNAIPEVGEILKEMLSSENQKWIESKKSPRRISQGTTASKTVIPKDRDERLEMAVEAMEEAQASG